ncbi:MAG: hypothetical protein GY847_28470 [Proteobacteria bacterium]|nr:hypothetical protein [Pseudomonadota bacterium]
MLTITAPVVRPLTPGKRAAYAECRFGIAKKAEMNTGSVGLDRKELLKVIEEARRDGRAKLKLSGNHVPSNN